MPTYKKIRSTALPSVRPSTVQPLTAPAPSNPRMVSGSSWMHDDGNASDSVAWAGPWKSSPIVTYFKNTARGIKNKGGMCPGFAFDSQGRVYTTSFGFGFAKLLALDSNLDIQAEHSVPKRKNVIGKIIRNTLRFLSAKKALKEIFRDTSGGAYFIIDDQDRIILPTSRNTFWLFERTDTATLDLAQVFDVYGVATKRSKQASLPVDEWRKSAGRRREKRHPHRLVGMMPVAGPASEERYWFTTNRGVIGVVSRKPQVQTATFDLNGAGNPGHGKREEIQNSFAASAKGAFIVSNYALYRFSFDGSDIKLEWRKAYCRLDCPTQTGGVCPCGDPTHTMASGKQWAKKGPKPGQINVGSGTTPTLVGDEFVAIADGAPRLGLLLFYQDHGGRAGRIEVFGTVDSACENSVVTHGDMLFIGNTYGYVTPFQSPKRPRAGTHSLERVDIVPLDQEHPVTGRLVRRWFSDVNVGSAPPKLSTGNGLLYTYSLTRQAGWHWSLLAFDTPAPADPSRSKPPAYKLPVFSDNGRVKDHDNAWGTMSIGPNGDLFLCMWKGFLHVDDP